MGLVLERLKDPLQGSNQVSKFPDLFELPPELSLNILKHLNATDLCLAACVWQTLANDEILWLGSNWAYASIYSRARRENISFRRIYLALDEGTLTFNANYAQGLNYFIEHNLIDDDAMEIGKFIHNTRKLKITEKRKLLQNRRDVLERLIELQSYENQFLPNALRNFFAKLDAPEERNEYLSVLIETFSKRFCECNKEIGLTADKKTCRCLPNDGCWPNPTLWELFNVSIDGRLLRPLPSASPCYNNSSLSQECNSTRAQWRNAQWRSNQVGAMQNPNWETNGNLSCTITYQQQCHQGSVPVYGVNATSILHVQESVKFARKYNLRLVVKTTGHDYIGRSTAAGSFLLWLHYMKNISLNFNFTLTNCSNVSSVAMTAGAGIQWSEAYAFLNSYNLVMIGGAAGSVGAAGGFVQGGGHGPLARLHGLSADNVLQFEVVTADGQVRIANQCENKDLFWALRGGGGGTFGILISATYRTFASPTITFGFYSVNSENETMYNNFITDFIRYHTTLDALGWAGYFYMTDTNIEIAYFLPNGNVSSANTTFTQLLSKHTEMNITENIVPFTSFYEFFHYIIEPANPTGSNVLLGSRLIPELLIHNNPDQVAQTLINIKGRMAMKSVLIGHLVAGGQVANGNINDQNTSVNPAWRNALFHIVYARIWDDISSMDEQKRVANDVTGRVEAMRQLTPNSGCYLNEADPNEPNWQDAYFGSNYARLKMIKDEIDPSGLFTCKNCVGSEEWLTPDLNCPISNSANNRDLKLMSFAFVLYSITFLYQH
ncbi:unnamed protein product [Didymodactylos carnosus]|uniref:FAD-binding PCMH-type domain-containing protein n=1 Tax=Didymodactylos carnosus TaxID=1234261 RepID=A0A813PJZ2_9BILA|nr:unnamed protein product [Didymodactylos carnosus]CAF3536420.1 unnamed protein product [Didymodactylos carnosus]